MDKLSFTEKAIKEYLDKAIRHWRTKRDLQNDPVARYYIDAFQSVRTSIFGETLPEEKEEQTAR